MSPRHPQRHSHADQPANFRQNQSTEPSLCLPLSHASDKQVGHRPRYQRYINPLHHLDGRKCSQRRLTFGSSASGLQICSLLWSISNLCHASLSPLPCPPVVPHTCLGPEFCTFPRICPTASAPRNAHPKKTRLPP